MEDTYQQEEMMFAGRRLVSWHVDEYKQHERSRLWYIIASLFGTALIIYAIATANFLFAVIVLMSGIIILISGFRDPGQIDVIITSTGIVIGEGFHEYKAVRDFSIVYEPPETKFLYFEFHSPFEPTVAVPLEDVDPNVVREVLLPYCLENLDRREERLTEVVQRLYKL